MKKLIAIVLAVLTVLSFSTVAFAEGNTTTLTTTVPDATYTLNIPADQEIPFGTEQMGIGNLTVTNSSGFAVGKNLKVAVSCPDGEDGEGYFTSEDTSTKIAFRLCWMDATVEHVDDFGSAQFFRGQADGTVFGRYKPNPEII